MRYPLAYIEKRKMKYAFNEYQSNMLYGNQHIDLDIMYRSKVDAVLAEERTSEMKKQTKEIVAFACVLCLLIPADIVSASSVSYYNGVVVLEDYAYNTTINEDQIAQDALMGLDVLIPNDDITVAIDNQNMQRQVTQEILLRKRVLANGSVVLNYLYTQTGEKWEESYDPSYTVRLKIGVYYEVLLNNGVIQGYKIYGMYNRPTLLDSQFRLYKTTQTANESGPGYNANGTSTLVDLHSSFYIDYPVSGLTYTRYTAFTQYVAPDYFSIINSICTLTFQRRPTGVLYYFSMVLNIP